MIDKKLKKLKGLHKIRVVLFVGVKLHKRISCDKGPFWQLLPALRVMR